MRHTEPEKPTSARTARDALLNPANLVPFPVLGILAVGQHYHFVAREPLWLLLGALLFTQVFTTAIALAWPPGSDHARPRLHLCAQIFLSALVMYLTGWGAVLGIGFVFAAAIEMSSDGSWLAPWAIGFSCAAIAAGEVAIELGLVQTMLNEPVGHGLALLECSALSAVIWLLGYSQREKERVETSLRRSEERFRALVQHAADAILVLDAQGLVAYVSPAVQRLLGYTSSGVTRFESEWVHPDHVEQVLALWRDVVEHPGVLGRVEAPLRRDGGEYHWFEIGLTNLLHDPAVQGVVCNMRDINERRVAQEQLQFQAHHDALTRLPNRWHFLERLEQAQRNARADDCVAVLFLDIDNFKLVNDSLGHEVGDRMLSAVAERLGEALRPGDLVGRFGGDEFTILLEGLPDPSRALAVAERLTMQLHDPIVIDGRELFASSSIGVALSRGGVEEAGELLKQADLAMYTAKERGRARWELFDPSLAPSVMDRLELEGDLWRAIEHRELAVNFQPEVSLETGAVVATEALLRWNHPTRGLLQPGSFIPLAEESTLIVAVDRFVLREACAWARRWSALRPRTEPLVVSVNLSPRYMHQPDVVADITGILRETRVDPRCVQIEITERIALTDLDTTCTQLHRLRTLGLRVAVDDFGTGYSSLSYLKRLPIDVLKLDKSFVDGIDGESADVAIAEAIVTMGHALGVKITAEGVERRAQAARLRDLGCDSAMGWLWARAMPPEELSEVAPTRFPVPTDGTVVGRVEDDGVVVPLRARG